METMDSFAIQAEPLIQLGQENDAEQLEPLEEVPDSEGAEEQKTQRQSGFIVVTTGRNCKRLHKAAGGCWMAREKIFKDSQEFEDKPDETHYTHVCRVCWPKVTEGDESSGETSSDTSDSETSSSSS